MKKHKVDVIVTKEPPRIEDFGTPKEFNEIRMVSVKKTIKRIFTEEL